MVAHSPASMVRRRPPWWLVAAKLALAALLVTGALLPSDGGFAGKGMAFRLPLFLLPAPVIPFIRLVRRGATSPYPVLWMQASPCRSCSTLQVTRSSTTTWM